MVDQAGGSIPNTRSAIRWTSGTTSSDAGSAVANPTGVPWTKAGQKPSGPARTIAPTAPIIVDSTPALTVADNRRYQNLART